MPTAKSATTHTTKSTGLREMLAAKASELLEPSFTKNELRLLFEEELKISEKASRDRLEIFTEIAKREISQDGKQAADHAVSRQPEQSLLPRDPRIVGLSVLQSWTAVTSFDSGSPEFGPGTPISDLQVVARTAGTTQLLTHWHGVNKEQGFFSLGAAVGVQPGSFPGAGPFPPLDGQTSGYFWSNDSVGMLTKNLFFPVYPYPTFLHVIVHMRTPNLSGYGGDPPATSFLPGPFGSFVNGNISLSVGSWRPGGGAVRASGDFFRRHGPADVTDFNFGYPGQFDLSSSLVLIAPQTSGINAVTVNITSTVSAYASNLQASTGFAALRYTGNEMPLGRSLVVPDLPWSPIFVEMEAYLYFSSPWRLPSQVFTA
jgi:hypothetical protein